MQTQTSGFYDTGLTPSPETLPASPPPGLAAALAGRLVVVGGGNMARALLGGALAGADAALLARVRVVERSEDTRTALARDLGVTVLPDLSELPAAAPELDASDTVLWAVKPQGFAAAAAELPPGFAAPALHVSVMAGVTLARLAQATGAAALVRTMPNTPALVGQGMTGLFAAPAVSAAQRNSVQALLKSTGELLWVEAEGDLDSVTAVSGSGPAYVFLLMEAMMAAGRDMGLPAAAARQLVLQTLAGATALARASEVDPAVLRARVTSPGGTTHAAISHMLDGGLPALVQAALHKARERSQELGQA
ncbi:pyrroline-5-carboxylate reductase [Amphibiibacter pelophylacis]|uniref:Pyrroline-5-carboxylate reductase n=1 Tax=Amphibiibacter pelophylacis TaxID=1799477 RepID=A0ACC6P3F3_9BURK